MYRLASNIENVIFGTPSGPYYKKQLTFLVHCVSNVSNLYFQ